MKFLKHNIGGVVFAIALLIATACIIFSENRIAKQCKTDDDYYMLSAQCRQLKIENEGLRAELAKR